MARPYRDDYDRAREFQARVGLILSLGLLGLLLAVFMAKPRSAAASSDCTPAEHQEIGR